MQVPDALVSRGIDQVDIEIAILESTGTIIYTNQAWRQFAIEGGFPGEPSMVGENYLSAVDASREDDRYAEMASDGLSAVVDSIEDYYQLEYPCPSPTETNRWFDMVVSAFEFEDERYLLITHTDITERKRAQRRELERNEVLAGVASVLSHDLKNPMAAAIAWGEAIESDPDPAHIERMISALYRMDRMIDGAVVLARETSVTAVEPVDVAVVARSAWETIPTAEATLTVEEVPTVLADEGLLGTIFENLFRNAVEHSGPTVELRVGPITDPVSQQVTGFYVEDDGPGIPIDQREQVFQTGVSSHNRPENTGLGLAIVKGAVGAHEWLITITDGTDGGARFEITNVTFQRESER